MYLAIRHDANDNEIEHEKYANIIPFIQIAMVHGTEAHMAGRSRRRLSFPPPPQEGEQVTSCAWYVGHLTQLSDYSHAGNSRNQVLKILAHNELSGHVQKKQAKGQNSSPAATARYVVLT